MFLDTQRMSDESDDELPANWETAKTSEGHVFYINHQTQQTQWEHPITKQVKIVPKGTSRCVSILSMLSILA